jgi:hypothetical protein
MPPGPPRPLPQLEQIVSTVLQACCSCCWGLLTTIPSPYLPCSPVPLQNAEIFSLTYGSIVRQLIADFEDLDEVNKQLEKM